MSNVRYGFPKYRVFIFGHEVTKDVVSVTTTLHDGQAPNMCQIELVNEQDKYIITTEDLAQLTRDKTSAAKLQIPWLDPSGTGAIGDFEITRKGAFSPGDDAFLDRLGEANFNADKKAILERKNAAARSGITATDKVGAAGSLDESLAYTNYFGKPATRYPLADGCPIFHPMDQVRVFMRDPFDSTRWYHQFCGFVSDMVDTLGSNNDKMLTIQIEDPTKLFRYTRIFQNPGILDATKVIRDEDLQVQNFYTNFLKGHNLPEIFFTLIFGPDKIGNETISQMDSTKNPPSPYSTRIRGIGHFSLAGSGIYMYGPDQDERRKTEQQGTILQDGTREPPKRATSLLDTGKAPLRIDDLSVWQALIDHEVFATDLAYMVPDHIGDDIYDKVIAPLIKEIPKNVDGVPDINEVIKLIGEHPDWYPVDGGKLLMLIPNSLGPDNRNIVETDIIQSYPLNSDWHSAGMIMYKTIERIQFSLQCSPKGDIIVEFPLFDFDPDDFGMEEISESELKTKIRKLSAQSEANLVTDAAFRLDYALKEIPSGPRGPYGPRYVIRKDDTSRIESAIVDDKVFTMAVGAPNIFQNYESEGTTAIIGRVIPVVLTDLVPLYGLRQIPMIQRGNIADEVGMKYYVNTTLNRLNADAHTIKIEHLPRLSLGVNRPVYIEARNCLATVKQVSHAISWGSNMSTTTDLYATRVWDGTMSEDNPNVPIFMPLGGAGSRPLNYSMLHNKFLKPEKERINPAIPDPKSAAVSEISPPASVSLKKFLAPTKPTKTTKATKNTKG